MKRGLASWLCAAALAAGCAHAPPSVPELPSLRLAPATLGRSLALQQTLLVLAPGRPPLGLELLLEADAEVVRLAVLGMGQTIARLQWDGHQLTTERAPGWPPAVAGERVLFDLQLALWPAAALRNALPPDWHLEDSPGRRVLRQGDEAVVVIAYPDARRIDLEHRRQGYRLQIESRSLEPLP